MEDKQKNLINIGPPKKFFFETLVLDITPEEAILELIDTFIEWYMFHKKRKRIDKGAINIKIEENIFEISSDYPGPPEDMVDKLLRLGEKVEKGCSRIGAYGIGTKRALFKFGQNIHLESNDGEIHYWVDISSDWFKKDDYWTIPLHSKKSDGQLFDKIIIKDLYPQIKKEFRSSVFINGLKKRVGEIYMLLLHTHDIDIKINNEKIGPPELKFIYEENLMEPYYYSSLTQDKKVKVTILAGLTKRENETYGWYVFCNNRLVLKNDVSDKTGFNHEKDIIFHPKYHNIFLGVVCFNNTLFCFKDEYYKRFKQALEEDDKNRLKEMLDLKDTTINIKAKKKNGGIWVISDEDSDLYYEVEDLGDLLIVCSDPKTLPWKSSKDDIREDSGVYREIKMKLEDVTKRFLGYIEELTKKKTDIDILESITRSEKIETKSIKELMDKYSDIKGEKLEILNKLLKKEELDKIVKGFELKEIRGYIKLDVIKRVKESLGNVSMSDEEMIVGLIEYYRRRKGL